MLIVGLTGNIASGKSAVAAHLAAHGAFVIDADRLAREAVEKGSAALARIAERWGERVLSPDGSLDRAALRRIVFDDAGERAALNAIVHPEVAARREHALAAAEAAGARIVILDIPLLFESQLEHTVDRIILVDAPVATRRARITEHRGLSPAEADAMIAAQMPSEKKRPLAHYIIENAGSLEELRSRVNALWRELDALADASQGDAP
jgi:dephospho-CoA kinase